ncbi:MAG TPA: AzlC family ABC transporter permease [Lacisediminihabitans sp.]|uniref:AzlC family ABC transporter permease n=1 Tax=Lacisediminihabitans sp. TaxID=2787631 RepID=UPI002EDB801A
MSTDSLSCARQADPSSSHEVHAGIRIALSAALGVGATGVTFGVLVVQTGLPWWWAPLCQTVVFAGSLEFVLVGLAAACAPLSTIALSSLLVNSRHVFYALSFPLDRVRAPLARAYSVYTLTDEAYALTSVPEARIWSGTRIVAIQATLQISWVGGGLIGVGLGSLLPPEIPGLSFAFTALFVVLAMDAYRASASPPLPLLAAACATAAAMWTPGNMLLVAMTAYTVVLITARPVARRGGRKAVPRAH